MRQIKTLIKTFSIFLIIAAAQNLFAQSTYKIDYYGVVSSEIDENMYKMTSDLYYTQLCEINSFSITDKRSDSQLKSIPDQSSFSSTALSFYAVIEKKENSSNWISTLYVVNKGSNTKKAQAKEYDSYYKILMEPKSVLQDTIKNLISNNSIETSTEIDAPTESSSSAEPQQTELLAGTWSGEENIDKIVIMRGGRGFVIFKNGASMNILVTVESENKITITQNARSNASFFPELPRQVALKEAVNAKPIKWTFSMTDRNTLEGIKNTLISDGESVKEGVLDIIWTRK